MTAAERQQLKRDRIKAGLVLIQVWVPTEKADAVRDAVAAVLADCHVSETPNRAGRVNYRPPLVIPPDVGWI